MFLRQISLSKIPKRRWQIDSEWIMCSGITTKRITVHRVIITSEHDEARVAFSARLRSVEKSTVGFTYHILPGERYERTKKINNSMATSEGNVKTTNRYFSSLTFSVFILCHSQCQTSRYIDKQKPYQVSHIANDAEKEKKANTHNNKVETDIKIIYLLFPESTERWWISSYCYP